jgi:WD40 repeat protein
MDPIAAFRAAQKRNGDPSVKADKTILELRLENPTVALIFDGLDKTDDGSVNFDAAVQGLISSVGHSVQAPTSQKICKHIFKEVDTEGKGLLKLRQFFEFMQQAIAKLKPDDDKGEDRQALREKLAKPQEVDVFAVLGIKKTKDLAQVEDRKKKALQSNTEQRQKRLSLLGEAIMRSSAGKNENEDTPYATAATPLSLVKRIAGLKRAPVSIDSVGSAEPINEDIEPISPTKKLRDAWERFSISSSSGTSSRHVTNSQQIHLSEYLPQVRALGKRNAGCVHLSFSNDGSQVAGGFFDGGIRIYNVDDATQVHTLNLPKSRGGSAGNDFDSRRISIGSEEEEMLPDVKLKDLSRDWEPVTSVSWAPAGGNLLASVDTKGSLQMWQIPKNKQHWSAKLLGNISTGGALSSVCFTCDGAFVAAAGNDKVIKLFDVAVEFGKATFRENMQLGNDCGLGKMTGHALKVMSVRAHPRNPAILVSVGLDRSILVWDTRTASGNAVGGVQGPELAGDSIDICKDGIFLLAGSHRTKNPIEIFDLRMSAAALPVTSYSWRGNEPSSEGGGRYTTCRVFSAAWNAFDNSTIVASGENENLARVFERPSDPEEPLLVVGTLRGKEHSFWSSAVDTDGRKVAFGSSDGAVCLMDVVKKF